MHSLSHLVARSGRNKPVLLKQVVEAIDHIIAAKDAPKCISDVLLSHVQEQGDHSSVCKMYHFLQLRKPELLTPHTAYMHYSSSIELNNNPVDELEAEDDAKQQVYLQALLDHHVKHRNLKEAQAVFTKLISLGAHNSLHPFHSMITLLIALSQQEATETEPQTNNGSGHYFYLSNDIFNIMKDMMVTSGDQKSYRLLLHSLWSSQLPLDEQAEHTRRIVEQMEADNVSLDLDNCANVITLYVKAGQVELADQYYKQTLEWISDNRDHVQNKIPAELFNRMAEGFSYLGKPAWVEKVMEEMISFGLQPKAKFFSTLIRSYVQIKRPDLAEKVLMEGLGDVSPTVIMYQILINFYLRKNNFEKAETLLQTMKKKSVPRDTIMYEFFMTYYSQLGQTDLLDNIIQTMNDEPWMQETETKK